MVRAPETGSRVQWSSGSRNPRARSGGRAVAAPRRLRRLALCMSVIGASLLSAAGVAVSQGAIPSLQAPDARLQAPIGHRQPRPSDLPPSVRSDEQYNPPSAQTQPQNQTANRRLSVPQVRAGSVPTIDVRPTCQAAAGGLIGVKQDIQICLEDEQKIRDQVAKEWTKFRADDRASCTRLTTMSGGGTYTELLTCLEMMRDARNLPNELTIGGDVMR
jgi:hypothetical protein